MKYKKTLTAFLCAGMLLSGFSAHAAETDQDGYDQLVQQAQELSDAANSLSPESTEEEFDNFLSLLESMDTESTDSESSLAGTMDSSLAQRFEQLQQELSQTGKTQSEKRIEQIMENQQMCDSLSSLRAQLRELSGTLSSGSVTLPDSVRESLVSLGVCDASSPLLAGSADKNTLESLISMTEARIEMFSSIAKEEVSSIQDYMDQYNSYVQGASEAINSANETLKAVAQGGTMLGDSQGAGMLFTGLLGGAAAGIVGTLLVQRFRRKGK